MRRRLLLALLALLATAGATRPAASDERALTALVEEELEGDGDEELGREAGIEADELREMPAHAWTPASSPRKHKHRCLFLHGTGLSPGRLTGLYTQLDSYWGSEVRRELGGRDCTLQRARPRPSDPPAQTRWAARPCSSLPRRCTAGGTTTTWCATTAAPSTRSNPPWW
jgi:hypothetical protein